MSSRAFDFSSLFPDSLPAPATKWTGGARYNFTGGNNDPGMVPVDALREAADKVLAREGRALSNYTVNTGPQGYLPLREFIAQKLKHGAEISCSADDIVMVSGSLQALDLVNAALCERGDTVIYEEDCYQGSINRMVRMGVNVAGIPLDKGGMRMDALANALAQMKSRGVRPKFIYTIPTVQNPTATILSEERRLEMLRLADEYNVPIFEDDCYADLIWSGERPPALYAMSQRENVDLHRFVFEAHRAGAAGRLHRRAVAGAFPRARAEDRCRFRRARADGAGRVLQAAFRKPCSAIARSPARKAGYVAGVAERAVRHGCRIRRCARRNLPLDQAARSGR
jgi:hypothetical protein